MIDAKITIDATLAQKALQALTAEETKQKMAEAVADINVLPAIQNYPPQSGKKMEWASDKQRRGFFAKLRDGAIQVPYRRSGDYGGSFAKQPIPDGTMLVSHLPYAPYVRGMDPPQAAYHKGNWDTLEQIADKVEDQAAVTATAVLLEAVEDATV